MPGASCREEKHGGWGGGLEEQIVKGFDRVKLEWDLLRPEHALRQLLNEEAPGLRRWERFEAGEL